MKLKELLENNKTITTVGITINNSYWVFGIAEELLKNEKLASGEVLGYLISSNGNGLAISVVTNR